MDNFQVDLATFSFQLQSVYLLKEIICSSACTYSIPDFCDVSFQVSRKLKLPKIFHLRERNKSYWKHPLFLPAISIITTDEDVSLKYLLGK